MAIVPLIEYEDAAPEVRAVYDDIMRARGTDRVNNFWKALASHPATLARTWASLKEVMAPGDREWRVEAERERDGIPVDPETAAFLGF